MYTLFDTIKKEENNAPLADRMRPQSLSDVVGQKHILGEGKVLYNIIQSGEIPNMIFYGPLSWSSQ